MSIILHHWVLTAFCLSDFICIKQSFILHNCTVSWPQLLEVTLSATELTRLVIVFVPNNGYPRKTKERQYGASIITRCSPAIAEGIYSVIWRYQPSDMEPNTMAASPPYRITIIGASRCGTYSTTPWWDQWGQAQQWRWSLKSTSQSTGDGTSWAICPWTTSVSVWSICYCTYAALSYEKAKHLWKVPVI